MTDLTFSNVSKSFASKRVLEDFSRVFPAGSVTCVLGPSGRGKTTLLRLAAGLETPDSGFIGGRPERLAFVFQEDRLCEEFTLLRNLRLVTGAKKPREELLALLEELGLADEASSPVRSLSGGMKRRAAIARALCAEGELLLLDEPFKGLDAPLKRRVIAALLARTADATVLCVTHDEEEARLLGGETLRMN